MVILLAEGALQVLGGDGGVPVMSRTIFRESFAMPNPAAMNPAYMFDILVVMSLWMTASAVSWMRVSMEPKMEAMPVLLMLELL
jgi:hypothetical protein